MLVPTFHSVPIGFETKNIALLDVEQEEWNYYKGNSKQDVIVEDCYPWEKIKNEAIECSYKCLPVIYHFLWKEKVDRPRCLNGSHHICMIPAIVKGV